MRQTGLFIVAVVLVGLFASSAQAWNITGHMTVGQIAWRRLSAEDRAAVTAILRQHPHYDRLLVNDVPVGVNADEWAFMKACYWPDLVRPVPAGDRNFKPRSITDYHRSAWHYINMPIVIDNATTRPSPELSPATTQSDAKPSEPVHNVLEAIDWNNQILANAGAPAAEQAVAICWLGHLVGDVHQPLHAATMFSEDYPEGDRGGNSQTMRIEGNVINLHSFWDQALGTTGNYDAVKFLADDILRDPRCDATRISELTAGHTPQAWADESNRLAIGFVYNDGRLRTIRSSDVRDRRGPRADRSPTTAPSNLLSPATSSTGPTTSRATRDELPDVPDAPTMYAANARDVARVRIALAGARLANTLHAALAR